MVAVRRPSAFYIPLGYHASGGTRYGRPLSRNIHIFSSQICYQPVTHLMATQPPPWFCNGVINACPWTATAQPPNVLRWPLTNINSKRKFVFFTFLILLFSKPLAQPGELAENVLIGCCAVAFCDMVDRRRSRLPKQRKGWPVYMWLYWVLADTMDNT